MTDFNPTTDANPAQTVNLWTARQKFFDHKYDSQKDSTARPYKYPTKSLIQYAENRSVTVPGNLTKGLVNTWIDKRGENVNILHKQALYRK